MEIAISSVLLAQITDHAAGCADEVCGLVFGDRQRVSAVTRCFNVAADPARRFAIDPRALIEAHRAARGGGPQPIGHYHSHPGGSSAPSPRDAADAIEEGALWLIVGAAEVRAWRAIRGGAVEGRFEPVGLRMAG
ncbi:M67 family metallopeptidase [Sphingomonas oligophenolica]|uniref:M67 family metallopeptidase n=1 Tax=Sphingomonas oligophenolica TaxID=301154 RepID=UPI001F4FA51E|nr:M67 family metallopeptidase [Sphingomonas oligophenolica]